MVRLASNWYFPRGFTRFERRGSREGWPRSIARPPSECFVTEGVGSKEEGLTEGGRVGGEAGSVGRGPAGGY